MKFRSLIYKNITFFTRYYRLVAVAVIITVTVIVGSLVVGDSVYGTLTARVAERLGETETIIFSRNSFMDENLPDLFSSERKARGVLLSNGFVSRSGKLVPVFVWGVDDMSIARGTARINPALAKELSLREGEAIILRLPATGMVPSGTLFVTESYTTSLRLAYDGIVESEEGGNISMKNEQVLPFNIFVDRKELDEAMEIEGKINLILVDDHLSGTEFEKAWDYPASGLSFNRKEHFTEILSDRVFLQQEVIETVSRNNREPNRLFSYLANAIETEDHSIPYSFVTAIDRYQSEQLDREDVILSDYSANRLQVKVGDRIRMTYFTSEDLKTLKTDTVMLRVRKIVPIAELEADTGLSADFPGLSDVERCTEWDSDLPINMDLITDEDEQYWENYRSTPKAIIAYSSVADDWSNAYGNATAIRIDNEEPDLSGLRSEMFGIQLLYPREIGLAAAKNGIDFSSLFLALGFFIIVSAILLMIIPLSEMLFRRQGEIELLQALGYTRKRITTMLWMESAPVVFISSIIGVVTGLLYTGLVLWLLGSVWKGATQTDGFSIYPAWTTLLTGFLVSAFLSLLLLRITIARSLKQKQAGSKPKVMSLRSKRRIAGSLAVITFLIVMINFLFLKSVPLFVIVGILLLVTAALWGDYLISRNGSGEVKGFDRKKMVWSTLYARRKQAVLSFFALAIGVFIVFSVGLNRQGFGDSSSIRTGTGGYSLWGESSVPVYHNMSTQAGREKLSLTGMPAHAEYLQFLRYGADDASCLNLNKVSTPNVLGVDMKALAQSDFRIVDSWYPVEKEEFFNLMQTATDSVYPALVDETVLMWSLGLSLGDTLRYEGDKGKSVLIRLAGTLSNSVFQGNILIDRSLFSEIWEEITGSEVFLVRVEDEEKEQVATLMAQALNEYGVRISTTNERLKQFNVVTDTYLTIFMTLGGLGLLLGIMSFIIVIRKNLAMRRKEIDLYRTVGFTDRTIEETLYRENMLVPLYAILTGVISSIIGISAGIRYAGPGLWIMAFLFTLFFIGCVILFVKQSVKREMQ